MKASKTPSKKSDSKTCIVIWIDWSTATSGLSIFTSEKKLGFFLIRNVLVKESSPTLTVEDFMGIERITAGNRICLYQNRPLVAVLQSIQITMQVFLSDFFEGVFDAFIADLEGKERPLELIPTDKVCKFRHLESKSKDREKQDFSFS